MKADSPRSAVERFRKKTKFSQPIRRVVDCGDRYLFESGTKEEPRRYEVKKKNGAVKKLKGPKSAAAKRKKTASAVGGILKAILRKVM
jgi:hypothetical protein